MRNPLMLLVLAGTFLSCRNTEVKDREIEKYRAEIFQSEKNFERMVADSGLPAAFSYYVADSGVVNVGDTLIRGKADVRKYYQNRTLNDVSLEWSPDFVDVSSSGDLGYTYGRYSFSFKDSAGTISRNTGIFHTVWKRQTDGSWKFVWD